MPGAGHWVMYERAEAFKKQMVDAEPKQVAAIVDFAFLRGTKRSAMRKRRRKSLRSTQPKIDATTKTCHASSTIGVTTVMATAANIGASENSPVSMPTVKPDAPRCTAYTATRKRPPE